MQLIRGLHNLKDRFINGCVATIGNYDGVHLGHKQILFALKKKSRELKIPSVIIIFEPQPAEFFTQDKASRLTGLREKLFLFAEYGIDQVLVLAFNAFFINQTAKYFIEKILIEKMHTRYLIIGDDFAFGYKREGNFELLNKYINYLKLEVEKIQSFKVNGVRVSSSFIRAALLQGNLKIATKFLGRPYRVSGRVICGNHIGRDLGFPTANIYLARRELPLDGVYAVRIYNLEKIPLFGIANIGLRPTFSGNNKIFEVHILNFSKNIYGRKIDVEFHEKIRDERKFASVNALKLQIKEDILQTRHALHSI